MLPFSASPSGPWGQVGALHRGTNPKATTQEAGSLPPAARPGCAKRGKGLLISSPRCCDQMVPAWCKLQSSMSLLLSSRSKGEALPGHRERERAGWRRPGRLFGTEILLRLGERTGVSLEHQHGKSGSLPSGLCSVTMERADTHWRGSGSVTPLLRCDVSSCKAGGGLSLNPFHGEARAAADQPWPAADPHSQTGLWLVFLGIPPNPPKN